MGTCIRVFDLVMSWCMPRTVSVVRMASGGVLLCGLYYHSSPDQMSKCKVDCGIHARAGDQNLARLEKGLPHLGNIRHLPDGARTSPARRCRPLGQRASAGACTRTGRELVI